MSSQDNNEDRQQREQELQERENALRLRELEAEIYQQAKAQEPPLQPTRKQEPLKTSLKQRGKKLVNLAKFIGFVVVVVVAVKIAYWVALAIMISTVAWIGYKLFLKDKQS